MKVRTESIGQTLNRLETYVRRFERRYECSSEEMLQAVKDGRKETAEISRWLNRFKVFRGLERKAVERMTELCIEMYGPARNLGV